MSVTISVQSLIVGAICIIQFFIMAFFPAANMFQLWPWQEFWGTYCTFKVKWDGSVKNSLQCSVNLSPIFMKNRAVPKHMIMASTASPASSFSQWIMCALTWCYKEQQNSLQTCDIVVLHYQVCTVYVSILCQCKLTLSFPFTFKVFSRITVQIINASV